MFWIIVIDNLRKNQDLKCCKILYLKLCLNCTCTNNPNAILLAQVICLERVPQGCKALRMDRPHTLYSYLSRAGVRPGGMESSQWNWFHKMFSFPLGLEPTTSDDVWPFYWRRGRLKTPQIILSKCQWRRDRGPKERPPTPETLKNLQWLEAAYSSTIC